MDLDLKVIAMKYPDIEPVAIGYEVNGVLYNLKDFQDLMPTLNKQGWHYKDRNFNIQGVDYRVAEVYKDGYPVRLVYPVVTDLNQETVNKLYPYMLPMDNLGIRPEFREYHKPVDTVNTVDTANTANTVNSENVSINWIDNLEEVFTEEEIKSLGDLNNLSDIQLERLEEEYDRRLTDKKISERVTYKLPEELSNYSLIYNNAFMSSTLTSEDKDEIERTKHLNGLRSVMRAMIAIPQVSTTSNKDDESFGFEHMGSLIEEMVPKTREQTPTGVVVSLFENVAKNVMKDLIHQYGDIENFIKSFLDIQEYGQLLHPITVDIGGISQQVYVVKRYDNNLGWKVDFMREKDGMSVLFPYALVDLMNFFGMPGNDALQFINLYMAPYYKDLGINVNDEDLKFDVYSPDIYDLHYVGLVHDVKDIHVFRDNGGIVYYIVDKSIGNYMLGSKILLNGDNFLINYRGDLIEITPKGNILNPEETAKVFTDAYQTSDANGESMLKTFYPTYTNYLEINNINEITNPNHLEVINNYKELLGKSKEFINNGMDSQNITQSSESNVQDIPVINGTGVDLFANQPVNEADDIDIKKPSIDDGIDIKEPSIDDGIDIKEPSIDDGIDIKKPSYDDDIDIKKPSKPYYDEADDIDIKKPSKSSDDDIDIKKPSGIRSELVTPDPNPYDLSCFSAGNIANAYAMIMGSIDQEKLGYFKTEFKQLLSKYIK